MLTRYRMLTRRGLLCVALIFLSAVQGSAGEIPLDPNLVALFSDLHIPAATNIQHQRAGLARCVQEILALNPRPASVLSYGDIAYLHGETNDYLVVKELVKPLAEAGIRWYACMGNHDRRAAFLSVFPEYAAMASLVPDRLVTLVETPHADFILLDSCLEGPVNGALDDVQRTWLQTELKSRSKPVFVGAHHPITETRIGELLAASPACKGYIYGHHHAWGQKTEAGVPAMCLPSTGHWGDIGYVLVRLNANEALFTLSQHDFYTPRPAATPDQAKPEWAERVKRNAGCQWRVPLKVD